MRPSEDRPMDPQVLAELEAIDATLAGEAVDPIHAELAETALLLAAGRPQIRGEFARTLDGRVSRRFAPDPSGVPARHGPGRRPWWRTNLGFGAAGACLASLLLVLVLVSLGGRGGVSSTSSSSSAAATASATSRSGASRPATTAAPAAPMTFGSSGGSRKQAGVPFTPKLPERQSLSSSAGSAGSAGSQYAIPNPALTTLQPAPPTGTQNEALAPTPATHGRKTIQSAQLQLMASAARMDTVSQELFDVVGQESGIVKHSSITAASGQSGYAFFSLSIPSGNLAATMTQLSQLRYADVTSRTDSSTDVNGRSISDQSRLADARALRTSLLKQLANATTETAITSLTAQIHDAEASIASDQATIRGLNSQVDYSSLTVTVNAGAIPVPVNHKDHSKSTGFTLGHAAHDAGRVLTVAAGVVLIALAVLLPLGLLAVLGAWIAYWVRRRRREHALDTA